LERLTRQFKKTRSKIANKTSKGTTWGVKEWKSWAETKGVSYQE
jgi:hypothetical protein